MIGFLAFMMFLALGVLGLAAGFRWLSERPGAIEGAGRSATRLDRLESALGTLEARIDDLQEQQRFLERLVSERPEPRSLPGRRESGEVGAEGAASDEGEVEGDAVGESEVDSILFDTGDGRGG